MPIGPSQGGSWWFAAARLGYSIMGTFCAGASQPTQGRWIICLSHTLEKTPMYSVAVLEHVVSLLTTHDVKQVSCWSDTGPHYRAYSFLGSLIPIMVGEKRWACEVNYSCEAHGKGRCDAVFSRLNHYRYLASQTQLLSTIEEVADVLNAACRKEEALNPSLPPVTVVCFTPKPKKDYTWWALKTSSLSHKIQTCYSWSFKLNDMRCKQLRGRGSKGDVLTMVNCKAHTLSELSSPFSFNFLPEIQVLDFEKPPVKPPAAEAIEAPAAPEALEDEAKASAVALVPNKFVNGWRCAYRLSAPELETPTKVLKHLAGKLAKMSPEPNLDVASAARVMAASSKQSVVERQALQHARGVAAKSRAALLAEGTTPAVTLAEGTTPALELPGSAPDGSPDPSALELFFGDD